MFTKTITFDDLEDNEVTQTFYFNYTKKEVAELIEFGRVLRFAPRPGVTYIPLEEMMAKLSTPMEKSGLSNRENNEQAYMIFENLLLDAYGVKGADNVSFDKSDELRHYWSTHVAFPELVFEFLGNTKLASDFIEKCLPAKLVARAKEEMEAEAAGKLSSSTITEMNEEAARRQQDPATRIEPGLKAAQDAGVAPSNPPFEMLKHEDLTEHDILTMDDESFRLLDPKKLSPEQMQVAFRRKMQNG